jgi:hypothetical protein
MICKWIKSGQGLYRTTAIGYDGSQYRLIAERVPEQRRDTAWDWAIWRAGSSEAVERHGYARSARAAMAAAESAAATELIGSAMAPSARNFPPSRRSTLLQNHFIAWLAIRNDRAA